MYLTRRLGYSKHDTVVVEDRRLLQKMCKCDATGRMLSTLMSKNTTERINSGVLAVLQTYCQPEPDTETSFNGKNGTIVDNM